MKKYKEENKTLLIIALPETTGDGLHFMSLFPVCFSKDRSFIVQHWNHSVYCL